MIYIYTFFVSVFFAYLAERSKDRDMVVLYSVLSILLPAILGGLRDYGVGTDTKTYGRPDALQALRSPNLIHFIMNNRCELGYKILVYFIMQIFGHENWCYFFEQLITVSCIYVGAWKHRKILSVPFIMLIFYFMHYNVSYNAIRQLMAEAVIFMGVSYLEKRQYIKFFFPYAVIATLLHYSAFVLYILLQGIYFITASEYFSKYQRTKDMASYLMLALMLVAKPILMLITTTIPFLRPYSGFLGMAAQAKVSNSMTLILGGELLLMILYYKGALRTISKVGLYNIKFFRYNVVFLLFYMYFVRFWSFRILMYQEVVNLIFLSSLPHFIKEKNLRIMVYAFIAAASLFYWWLVFISHGAHEVWPYRSIL